LSSAEQRIEDFSDDDAGDDTQVQPRPDDRDEDGDGDTHMEGVDTSDSSDLVKKLVRYALACEYSRTPIRRDGIKEKGKQHSIRQLQAPTAGLRSKTHAS